MKETRIDHWYNAEPQFARPSSHVFTLLSALGNSLATSSSMPTDAPRGASPPHPRYGSNPGNGSVAPAADAPGPPRVRAKQGSDGGTWRGNGCSPLLRPGAIEPSAMASLASTHMNIGVGSGSHALAPAVDSPSPGWLLGTLGSAGQSFGGLARIDSSSAAGSPGALQSAEGAMAPGGAAAEAAHGRGFSLTAPANASARSELQRTTERMSEGRAAERCLPPGEAVLRIRMNPWSSSDLAAAAVGPADSPFLAVSSSSGLHASLPSLPLRMASATRATATPINSGAAFHMSSRIMDSLGALPSSPPCWPGLETNSVGGLAMPSLSPHQSGPGRSPRLRLHVQSSAVEQLGGDMLVGTPPSAAAAAAALTAATPPPSVSARVMKLATLTNLSSTPQSHTHPHTPSSRHNNAGSERLSKLPNAQLLRTSLALRPGSGVAVGSSARLSSSCHDASGGDVHGSGAEPRPGPAARAAATSGGGRSAAQLLDSSPLEDTSANDGLLKLGSTVSDSEMEDDKTSAWTSGLVRRSVAASAPMSLLAHCSPTTSRFGGMFKFSDTNLQELENRGRTPHAGLDSVTSLTRSTGSAAAATAAAAAATAAAAAATASPGLASAMPAPATAATSPFGHPPASSDEAAALGMPLPIGPGDAVAAAGALGAVVPRFPGVLEEVEERCEDSSTDEQHGEEEGYDGADGQEAAEVEAELRWHEVQAIPLQDPVTGKQVRVRVQGYEWGDGAWL